MGADTCYPGSREEWTLQNPARDQCGMTALVVQDILGGDLIIGNVHVGPRRHRKQYELLRGRVLQALAAADGPRA